MASGDKGASSMLDIPESADDQWQPHQSSGYLKVAGDIISGGRNAGNRLGPERKCMAREPSQKQIDEVKNWIFADKKIDAIKAYRMATGCDLKHAKDVVEDLQQRLYQESPEKFSSPPGQSSGAGGLLIIVFLVAIGMAIWGLVHWIAARGGN
jgi:hypothetical protein